MIRGIGIDLVDVEELQNQIETIPGYLKEVFTSDEIECCGTRPNPYECFAARFAAKEAFMKALGTGWTSDVDFQKIAVVSDGASTPTIRLHPTIRKKPPLTSSCRILVSLTHLPKHAAAVVLLDD